MMPSILIEEIVIQLAKVDTNTASAYYLDATIAFLMSISVKMRSSNLAENWIRLKALDYILEWIDTALIKINDNLSTAVAKTKSINRRNFIDRSLRRYTREILTFE